MLQFHPSEPTCVVAGGSGSRYVLLFSALPSALNNRQTSTGPAPRFRPMQRVWLSAKDLPLQVERRKLAPRFVGPFEVEQMINPMTVRLKLPPTIKVHPTFYVSRVRPVVESDLSPPTNDPPPVQMVEGAQVYTVWRIMGVCRRGRGCQYLMDWEGYGPEERYWVPRRHILDRGLLRTFHQDHPDRPGSAPGGAR